MRPGPALQAAKPELLRSTLVPFPAGRIPALDGLRGIAILLVLLWHGLFESGPASRLLASVFTAGSLSWSGVDLFFVLSGFLIGGILLDAKNSPRYFRTFYTRRAFRILPLYCLVIALYIFYHLIFPIAKGIPLASYPTFTQNFWMAYLGIWGTAGMAVTWSLAVEEQFYLTIPFVVRKLTRRWLARILIGAVIAVPLLRTLIVFKFEHGGFADYVLMPCRADALCLGVLSAILFRDAQGWSFLLSKRVWLYSITGFLLIALAWLSFKDYTPSAAPMATFGYSLLALFYTCCLLIALMKTRTSQRWLCQRWLMELGGIAYCVYLLHVPLMAAGRAMVPICLPVLRRLPIPHVLGFEAFIGSLIGIMLTLIAARLSWRFFEQPMLQRGHVCKY